MGKGEPNGEEVSEGQWQSFLDATVSANLPNGYTVFDANGSWMNPVTHRTTQEGTKVLVASLPAVPQSLAAVNRIRAAYQIRFHQQLVGMTVTYGCGAF